MAFALLLGLALLSKHLQAASTPASVGNRPCVNFMLSVSVTAQNAEYDTIHVNDNTDATAWAVDVDTWSFNQTSRFIRNVTVSDTYDISVQLCVPPTGSKKQNLLIATHGLGFDKRYWDSTVDPAQYSFVENAIAAGYSILTYDRLGTGFSDKPDAYTIVQAALQLEILRNITEVVRDGGISKYMDSDPSTTNVSSIPKVPFEKIIHVGHSFGSIRTAALLTSYGNLSDAAVLTGYIQNPHFAELRKTAVGLAYAAQNDRTLFSDRSSGYMVQATKSDVQTNFFSTLANRTTGIGGFDPELLDYAYSIRSTSTTPEWLLQVGMDPAVDFKGPLQFVLAEYDFGVCRGDCRLDFDQKMLKRLYPGTTDIDIYTQAGSGHALTLHRKANLGYKATLDWLDKHGL